MIDIQELIQQARTARERARAPYSGYPVGAAVLTDGGSVYLGCNVESGAFSTTLCAERVAIFAALAAGGHTIQALAVVGVRGMAEQPVVVIDIMLNWNDAGNDPLRVIRLRGDQFDPHRVVGDGVSLAEAYRVLVRELAESADAVALSGPDSLQGHVKVFANLASYQREILGVES